MLRSKKEIDRRLRLVLPSAWVYQIMEIYQTKSFTRSVYEVFKTKQIGMTNRELAKLAISWKKICYRSFCGTCQDTDPDVF